MEEDIQNYLREPPIKKIRENTGRGIKLSLGLIYGLSFRIQAASYFP